MLCTANVVCADDLVILGVLVVINVDDDVIGVVDTASGTVVDARVVFVSADVGILRIDTDDCGVVILSLECFNFVSVFADVGVVNLVFLIEIVAVDIALITVVGGVDDNCDIAVFIVVVDVVPLGNVAGVTVVVVGVIVAIIIVSGGNVFDCVVVFGVVTGVINIVGDGSVVGVVFSVDDAVFAFVVMAVAVVAVVLVGVIVVVNV